MSSTMSLSAADEFDARAALSCAAASQDFDDSLLVDPYTLEEQEQDFLALFENRYVVDVVNEFVVPKLSWAPSVAVFVGDDVDGRMDKALAAAMAVGRTILAARPYIREFLAVLDAIWPERTADETDAVHSPSSDPSEMLHEWNLTTFDGPCTTNDKIRATVNAFQELMTDELLERFIGGESKGKN